eukprot:3276968-Prymnesium_polylepis.1
MSSWHEKSSHKDYMALGTAASCSAVVHRVTELATSRSTVPAPAGCAVGGDVCDDLRRGLTQSNAV